MYQGVCMSFQKDVDGAVKQLTSLDKNIQKSLPQAAEAGAGELKAEASRRVPVRSGKLKGGIDDRPGHSNEKTSVNSAVHVVFNSVFYAAPVEYGRYKRPFMRPSAQAASGKIAKAIQSTVMREADKAL